MLGLGVILPFLSSHLFGVYLGSLKILMEKSTLFWWALVAHFEGVTDVFDYFFALFCFLSEFVEVIILGHLENLLFSKKKWIQILSINNAKKPFWR